MRIGTGLLEKKGQKSLDMEHDTELGCGVQWSLILNR